MVDSILWRKPGGEFQPDCTKATVKHRGGNVKVWGCFSHSGVSEFVLMMLFISCGVLSGIIINFFSSISFSLHDKFIAPIPNAISNIVRSRNGSKRKL